MKWTNSYRSFGLKTKRSTGLKTIEHKQKKAETVPSKPSKPDNGDNDKQSDSNKPAATKPSASDKKADSKNDGKKQRLDKTGVDVRSWPVRWSPWPCWVPVLQR